ncbi:hypothetical protein ACLGIH_24735 [Streptomyces sp. HMX87]|uniref:hypothetical protein n=1 Tax=Streptomyces sp. HMX87 TaxID=3390849 RepID=UPI003A88D663
MSTLNFARVVLQCDGCQKRHGEPHGHNSAQEARMAAYIDGWRFPNTVKSDGSVGTGTSDVCNDCFPNWRPRHWQTGRGSGRRLSVGQAPRPEGGQPA